uniref:Uncharacterized protein n=1 Tax=Rhizophora mucronata TaxID=61149 RepID=A0A2P2QYD7_RHIMU
MGIPKNSNYKIMSKTSPKVYSCLEKGVQSQYFGWGRQGQSKSILKYMSGTFCDPILCT